MHKTSLFTNDPRPEADNESPSTLKAEVEGAMRSLNAVKSHGVDNVPSELIKHGGKATTVFFSYEMC
ncbi:hypothetical protein DPMN_174895 [Dreissena polymorpha]|uniref:Uncharacterized protein n=1 Tax=Dreissena polymorpha TaxID=45954 RepID=A0A9D4E681_DREPO|nr:hypothetical protein DPMN_174895 [Dreissena polymorpha]